MKVESIVFTTTTGAQLHVQRPGISSLLLATPTAGTYGERSAPHWFDASNCESMATAICCWQDQWEPHYENRMPPNRLWKLLRIAFENEQ